MTFRQESWHLNPQWFTQMHLLARTSPNCSRESKYYLERERDLDVVPVRRSYPDPQADPTESSHCFVHLCRWLTNELSLTPLLTREVESEHNSMIHHLLLVLNLSFLTALLISLVVRAFFFSYHLFYLRHMNVECVMIQPVWTCFLAGIDYMYMTKVFINVNF